MSRSVWSQGRSLCWAFVLMVRALWAWKVRRDHKRMTDLLAQAAERIYPGRSGMVKAKEVPYAREFGRG